ncbi:MAG: twin-arginine translocase TatA/TatE family subunit [Betaproteobacteria bacterium]|jgi:twin arginine-targeting protein translocase TatB|nr:twin-arginine translocase TatA/TatE family subunit [Betaproteobacteria bacterium]
MLDFSFTEVGLVGVVALIAIGPERMPKVARGAGVLFGRFRRYSQSVKAEIDRELHLAEMKEVERKIAEAKAEAARQIAASTSAVDGVLKQPLMISETAPVKQEGEGQTTLSPSLVVPEKVSPIEDGEEWQQSDVASSLERPKVGYALFGGDPFGVRRSSPMRSLARERTHEAESSS